MTHVVDMFLRHITLDNLGKRFHGVPTVNIRFERPRDRLGDHWVLTTGKLAIDAAGADVPAKAIWRGLSGTPR
ncbi:MAG: hypothetical protein JWQ69_802 [Pseudomonas sp.]|nr:hypothetical protein [Pseudomonas sp.]